MAERLEAADRRAELLALAQIVDAARDHALHQAHSLGTARGEDQVVRMVGQHPRFVPVREQDRIRSEEHTSELQSLMRRSYAVFGLKKKTRSTYSTTYTSSYSPQCHTSYK